MIFVWRGEVKVIYENNGEAFWMKEFDCVLQPSKIRHRVLENTDNFSVIEIASPAQHYTFKEHLITLPTSSIDKDKIYQGQKFCFFRFSESKWNENISKDSFYLSLFPSFTQFFDIKDTCIGECTNNFSQVHLLKYKCDVPKEIDLFYDDSHEFSFFFLLKGNNSHLNKNLLNQGDSFVIPPKEHYILLPSQDSIFLHVFIKSYI